MMNPVDINTAMYNVQNKKLEELAGVNKNKKSDEELKKAAQDFESVFVNQFLETISSTVEKSEDFSGGRGEEMFKSMLNGELAKNISSNSQTSFGFAKQVYEQMKNKV